MTDNNIIPKFAIVGHPNEGKSSVVSTLSEDDSVVISPTPGETVMCCAFPVTIDGKEIISFIDTPGFQNPQKMLAWLKSYTGPDELIVKAFREAHKNDADFKHDCELLSPIAEGAGIIYVVDGSRPLRNNDKAEMEVLRMTGRPRMAIINSKEMDNDYTQEWKNASAKHFNSTRIFNAHKATYAERIALLESLKAIDQDWQAALEKVIIAFKQDWEKRNAEAAEIVCQLLADCLEHSVNQSYSDASQEDSVKKRLQDQYKKDIGSIEKKAHKKIKKQFKHNIFNLDLPVQSILNEDLFSEKTCQVLGLKPWHLAAAAATTGAVIGAKIDLAAGGTTFGAFMATGAIAGAGTALWGGKRLLKGGLSPFKMGNFELKVGPNENIQFLYVLLDRALIFYSYTINWAHGRRDIPESHKLSKEKTKTGFTSEWDSGRKNVCNSFFKAIRTHDASKIAESKKQLIKLLKRVFNEISQSESKFIR